MLGSFLQTACQIQDRYIGGRIQNDMSVSFPFRSEMTLSTTLVAPVDIEIMFSAAPQPSCRNFPEAPSTVFPTEVTVWNIDMDLMMLMLSWMTLAGGEGGETVDAGSIADSLELILLYFSWFTSITNMDPSAEKKYK